MGKVQPTSGTLRFGAIVNEHREAAKLTRAQLAGKFPVSPTYIGRIIKGTSRCTRETAQKLDDFLNAGGEIIKAWKNYIEGTDYPFALEDYAEAEKTAVMLRSIQVMYIDGLLQAEPYVRALLPNEKAARSRLMRQSVLSRPTPPTLCAILDESTLRRQVAPSDVMREQLHHLLELSTRRNVVLQIARYSDYQDLNVNASFLLATQEDMRVTGFLETAVGGDTIRSHKLVSQLANTFAILQGRALNAEDSRSFIRRVAEEQ
ncbi:helix-turn-helix transcriptional regulator [Actinomadura kijaniata]|uniref:Transcriptional regulator with XRE-family HTH domain n=1 Tax=Actinomadura namibiensis TaxID=182080 RepID=A0A7W3LSW4_ACTNM|nr:helix-turn-helix transcriptional regulator [Actinomadura namibiensis]MBA8953632.1 transcriptional regulator with XRE-family HTH domain [Actinomadura namibiensis]